MMEKNIVHVSPEKAMSHLGPRLNGYRKSFEQIFIGVTTDPELRWKQHEANGWKKMVVSYEAFKPELAHDLEHDLIAYAHKCNFRVAIENIKPGGEAASNERKASYLYVVLR